MQDPERNRLAKLFIKMVEERITEPEAQELIAWGDVSVENKQILTDFSDEQLLLTELLIYESLDGKETWQKITETIPELAGVPLGDMGEKILTPAPLQLNGKIKPAALNGLAKPALLKDVKKVPRVRRLPFYASYKKNPLGRAAFIFVLLCKLAFITYLIRTWHPGGTIAQQIKQHGAICRASLSFPGGVSINTWDMRQGQVTQWSNWDVKKDEKGILYYQFGKKGNGEEQWTSVSTPRGGFYSVVLPDGSKVNMNAASKISFPTSYGVRERNVELEGEAYFDVKHPSAKVDAMLEKPFTVTVKNRMKVTATGTAFNISAYADDPYMKTTLLQGAVLVQNLQDKKSPMHVLKPGEQYLRTENGAESFLKSTDTTAVTAWKDGLFVFSAEPLRNVMQQIGRWYDASIRYSDTPSVCLSMRGTRQDDIAAVLHRLEATNYVRFTYDDDQIVVSR